MRQLLPSNVLLVAMTHADNTPGFSRKQTDTTSGRLNLIATEKGVGHGELVEQPPGGTLLTGWLHPMQDSLTEKFTPQPRISSLELIIGQLLTLLTLIPH